jgi:iron complex outermembrane receptor protein
MGKSILLIALLAGGFTQSARAQQDPTNGQPLSMMPIEALMELRVTSVSRKSEPLASAAAPIHVITQEEIRRSGMSSIPELLRMVPGLEVAQMDASTWAISSRGFNGQYAGLLLVLVDGRTVYTPTSNGVYWDVQDALLEDIDRIEVIRGPGAVLWGLNAVNGVINIVTRPASATQGGLLTASIGNQQRPDAGMRYGGRAGDAGFYRVFVRYFDRQAHLESTGLRSTDGWHALRAGFRADWDFSPRNSFTVLGGGYRGLEHHVENKILSLQPPLAQPLTVSERIAGGDLLTNWHHTFSDRSDLSAQTYFDYTERIDYARSDLRKTADFDLHHHIAVGTRHELTWGLRYRYAASHTSGSFLLSFDPRVSVNNTVGGFVQDEITLVPQRLRLVLGLRHDNDGDEGAEIQPDARLLWSPTARHSFWFGVSRPVGEPSLASRGIRFPQDVFAGPTGLPVAGTLLGNPDVEDISTLALQAGYRGEWTETLAVAVDGFHSTHKDFVSLDAGAPFLETSPPPAHLVLPIVFQNALEGDTHGLDLSVNWQAATRWKLVGSYSWLEMNLHHVLTGAAGAALTNGSSPQHQFQVRSYLDLPRNWEWDLSLYRVGRLPAIGVPAYTRLDTRIGYHLGERAEFSIVGQNLLRRRHPEFGPFAASILTTEVERSGYAKFTWTF